MVGGGLFISQGRGRRVLPAASPTACLHRGWRPSSGGLSTGPAVPGADVVRVDGGLRRHDLHELSLRTAAIPQQARTSSGRKALDTNQLRPPQGRQVAHRL
jgi:hypothetical protein